MAGRSKTTISLSFTDRSVRLSRRIIEQLVLFVAKREGVRLGHVDVAIVGHDEISAVNGRYLRHVGPTDVISFDLSDARTTGLCAQIVVCGKVAAEQAAPHGLKPAGELMLYIIHGLLHVMGYDDVAIRSAAKMHARQDELLSEFLAKKR